VNDKKKKRVRAKTNNHGLLIRRHNGPAATSRCKEFQNTSVIRVLNLEVKENNKNNN